MADTPWIPSQSDRALLQELLDERRVRRGNVPNRPPTEQTWAEGEDHQAPEVYIARPQTSDGIPRLLPTDGSTGTGTDISGSLFDEPGKAECDIYQIVDNDTTGDPELHNIGLTEFVHNLSEGDLSQDWIPVARTKFGKWVALNGGGETITVVTNVRVSGLTIQIKTRSIKVMPVSDESDWTTIHTGADCAGTGTGT